MKQTKQMVFALLALSFIATGAKAETHEELAEALRENRIARAIDALQLLALDNRAEIRLRLVSAEALVELSSTRDKGSVPELPNLGVLELVADQVLKKTLLINGLDATSREHALRVLVKVGPYVRVRVTDEEMRRVEPESLQNKIRDGQRDIRRTKEALDHFRSGLRR